MTISSDLQAELERLSADSIDGGWSLVVWADRAVKEYTSRHLAPLGKVFLEAWHSVNRTPTACSMAIYPSEYLRASGATDFLVLFRAFRSPEEPPFIVGEEKLRDTMKAETEAIRQSNEKLHHYDEQEPISFSL